MRNSSKAFYTFILPGCAHDHGPRTIGKYHAVPIEVIGDSRNRISTDDQHTRGLPRFYVNGRLCNTFNPATTPEDEILCNAVDILDSQFTLDFGSEIWNKGTLRTMACYIPGVMSENDAVDLFWIYP